jgi:hypothetical protein
VFGNNGMTVSQKGSAHGPCFQFKQASKRTFKSLEITALNDNELFELKELVLSEENARYREDDDGIELF